ncbi:MAG: MarR family transcriptional regulator [Clostridia bacterium]|nr:MarR family transcriptional regulator [Clostridia bacterium]
MEKGSVYKIPGKAIRLSNSVKWLRNQKMQSYGLTSAQADAIMFILVQHKRKNVTASDLISSLQLSQSTVAGIISRLELKGLITRSQDPNDNRVSILVPTEKGMELDDVLKRNAAETEKILLSGMTEAEMEELNRLLVKALENINRVREGSADV